MTQGFDQIGVACTEHICTTIGMILALAGLSAMLVSAFGLPLDGTMMTTWLWLALGVGTVAHRIHLWLAPLFWKNGRQSGSRSRIGHNLQTALVQRYLPP
jgi:hypothetical protein